MRTLNSKIDELARYFSTPLGRHGIDLEILLKNARILDVGCGEGRLVSELLEHNPNVYGVDRDTLKIEAMSGHAISQSTRFFIASASRLPCREKSFDVVISVNLYGVTAEDQYVFLMGEHIMPEIHRVLKEGGIYFIIDTAPIWNLPYSSFKLLYKEYPAMIFRKQTAQ
jgi:ubiquinone/menaquinone biosynthesis C-methylase UbiE